MIHFSDGLHVNHEGLFLISMWYKIMYISKTSKVTEKVDVIGK